jgi:hypothetical protein
MTKVDNWTKNARELVRGLSTATVEVESGEEEAIETLIPQKLEEMAA